MDLSRVPPPPREPSPRARDVIFRTQADQIAARFVGVMFLIIGLPMTVLFGWDVPADLVISLSSTRQTARFVESHLNRNLRINDEHPTRVVLERSIAGQVVRDELDTLDTTPIQGLRAGDPIEVEVSTFEPRWERFPGQLRSPMGYWIILILAFPAVGATLLFTSIRATRRVRRAFTFGQPAEGHVVRFGEDTGTRINGRYPTKLTWSFQAMDGQTYEGSWSSLDPKRLGEWKVNDRVIVLYDPARPKTNTLWVG